MLDIIAMLFFILFFITSIAIYVISTSSATLGILRVERGEGSLKFTDLLKDGLEYFWRQLGVFLIIQLSIGLVFVLFFACIAVSSIMTMGMASLCFQPFFILMVPLIFLMMGVLETAHTAVVNENLGSIHAVKRGLSIVREHIWKYVIITLTIFIGLSIIQNVVTFPMFLPVFFIPFLIETNIHIDPQVLSGIGIIFLCISFPFMAFFSIISQAIMKISLALTYLKLVQPVNDEAISLPERL